MIEVDGSRAALLSDIFVLWCLSRQVLQMDARLRPSSLHATHWNELPAIDHDPGYDHDHTHQNMLLWEAPDTFLGNKVSSSSCRKKIRAIII